MVMFLICYCLEWEYENRIRCVSQDIILDTLALHFGRGIMIVSLVILKSSSILEEDFNFRGEEK